MGKYDPDATRENLNSFVALRDREGLLVGVLDIENAPGQIAAHLHRILHQDAAVGRELRPQRLHADLVAGQAPQQADQAAQ